MADEEKQATTYLVQKRATDNKWMVKNMGSDKVIKLFDTKKEAMEFTKARAERNDRFLLSRASKGAKKGKFQ